jgi:O-antigen/teichoic acid export membrane protein
MLRSILKWTCLATFPACALLIGLGPQIIEYIYGPKWLPALVPFYLFTVNTAINAPVGVLTPALYSLGWSTPAARSLLIMLALTWATGLALGFAGVGLAAPAIAFLVGMVGALFVVLRALRDFGGFGLLLPLWRPLLSAVVGAGLLQAIAPAAVHDLLSLIIVGALAGVLMLAGGLWGEYASLLARLRSLLTTTGQPPAPSPTEERQDASIGNS